MRVDITLKFYVSAIFISLLRKTGFARKTNGYNNDALPSYPSLF